ncbi:MAG: alpha/beta hydrolase [Vampirovibrionales bacterium]|nr:alpha/beta hydrolase [Vampirovibrionales bacterium]
MPCFKRQNGFSIYYEMHGDVSSPTLLLLHGLASSLKIWTAQVVELKKYFHVIALDLPGHGSSDWQKVYTIHDVPSLICELMDAMSIKKVSLMGLSIGSTAAILFALEHPSRVRALVLEGPAGGLVPFSHPQGWKEWLQLSLTLNFIFLLWAMVGRKTGGKTINWLGKTSTYTAFLTQMHEVVDAEAMKGYGYSNANNPYQNRLHKINIPILILRGLNDQFPRHYSSYIKKNVSGLCYWLEIPLAEHLASLEKPGEFNMAAMAFLFKLHREEVEC